MERATGWRTRLLAGRVAVWTVKHVVAPADRLLYQLTGGLLLLGRTGRDVALLTTVGARTGRPRTIPVFCLRDGDRLVVCNVRPAGERTNPWPANLRVDPRCLVRLGRVRREYLAREVHHQELDRWWGPLVRQWPAYAEHFRGTGQRAVFVLEPTAPARPTAEEGRRPRGRRPGRRDVAGPLTRDDPPGASPGQRQ